MAARTSQAAKVRVDTLESLRSAERTLAETTDIAQATAETLVEQGPSCFRCVVMLETRWWAVFLTFRVRTRSS